jgi:hypothetical protein
MYFDNNNINNNNNNNNPWALHFKTKFDLCFTVSYSTRQSVVLLGWGISPPQDRCLRITTQTQEKTRQNSMSRRGFETMMPVFQRAKAVYSLHGAATSVLILVNMFEDINEFLR